MTSDFNPTENYPQLTDARLSLIADELRDVRDGTLKLYDPLNGDDSWCHGCRAYSRSKFRITKLSAQHTWLTIVKEDARLQFTFAIDGIPIRFYHGSADTPPSNYLIKTSGELAQRQLFQFREMDKILRLAIDTDIEGRVTTITLAEVDTGGDAIGVYVIPFGLSTTSKVALMEEKPVSLDPVKVEPLPQENVEKPKIKKSK